MLSNLESSQKNALTRNFIQSVGKQKETGCESYFFAFDGCGKKHLALLKDFEEKNLIRELE